MSYTTKMYLIYLLTYLHDAIGLCVNQGMIKPIPTSMTVVLYCVGLQPDTKYSIRIQTLGTGGVQGPTSSWLNIKTLPNDPEGLDKQISL